MANRKISQFTEQPDPTLLEEIGLYDPAASSGTDAANRRTKIKDAIKWRLVNSTDDFTIGVNDHRKYFRVNKATDVNITIDTSSLSVGSECYIEQVGLGYAKLNLSGVTVVANGSYQTTGIKTSMTLIKVSDTVFFLNKGSGSVSYSTSEETQVSHGFVAGDFIYHNGTQWTKAIIDVDVITNDSFATNIVVKSLNSDQFIVGGSGSIVEADLGFTGVKAIYLSGTAGLSTDVEPIGGYIQQLGWYYNGKVYFENHEPISSDGVYDQETDLYTLKIYITGSRFTADVLLKDVTQETVITNLVPDGLARYFSPDELHLTAITNTDSEGLTHRFAFNKLTANLPEIRVFSGTVDEVGEGSITSFRPSSSTNYYFDIASFTNVESAGINVTINPVNNFVTYTGDISQHMLFTGDLKYLL